MSVLDGEVAAAQVERLRTVHNSVYSPGSFEMERQRLFRRAWYLLCHESEVAGPGAFLRRRLGGDPVVVVRGDDGAVRGFHNVCRHRGCLVVPEESGCSRSLVCPYHHWTYSITDGSLVGVPQLAAYDGTGFRPGDYGLVPFRCETLFGFVFGCLDDRGPSLADYLGPQVREVMTTPFAHSDLQVFHVEQAPFAANWKTFAENIRDGYHVPFVHPWLRRSSPPQPYRLLDNHHAVQQLRLAREAVTEDEWQTTTAYPLPGMDGGDGYVLTIFPDSLVIVRSGEVHTMTVVPVSAEASILEIRVLGVTGDSPEVRRARQACYDLWSAKQPPEDTEVLQYQQEGLSSRSVRVSIVARGADAAGGTRGDDNRLRQFWAGWRAFMGLPSNSVPGADVVPVAGAGSAASSDVVPGAVGGGAVADAEPAAGAEPVAGSSAAVAVSGEVPGTGAEPAAVPVAGGARAGGGSVTSVGIVGLGVMGRALGRRLRAVGAEVSGVDVSAAARDAWQAVTGDNAFAGAGPAGAQDAWLVVVRGAEQAAAAISDITELGTPTEVYVLTTLAAGDADRLADTGGPVRVWPVAVSGGEPGALRGQLVAAVSDLLPEPGRRFFRGTVAGRLVDMGGFEQVATAKALANAMIAYQFGALARIVEVGVKLGVRPGALVDLVQHSSGGSPALGAVFEFDATLAGTGDSELAELLGVVDTLNVGSALRILRRHLGSV